MLWLNGQLESRAQLGGGLEKSGGSVGSQQEKNVRVKAPSLVPVGAMVVTKCF